MAEYSAFEVLGPVMVGPSSSHTAGACRIANAARKICGEDFVKVEFHLHGSFAYTYKGHGTDRALVAGIMGYSTDDDRIRTSFEIAEEKGLNYEIKTIDLGENYHPNSVKIVFYYENGESEYVIGSSIGGGAMVIVNINGIDVEFRGMYPTLLLQYEDQRGIISYISTLLTGNRSNIESIITKKNSLTNVVTLTIEMDTELSEFVKSAILNSDQFITAKYVGV